MNIDELIGKTLVAYLRVSSDKQDVERQRMAITEWAEKHGLKISFWFEDSDGRNPRDLADKREEFQRLLKFIEQVSVDFVVVDSLDRFGTKDAYEFGRYIDQLRRHGCSLWSIMEGNLSSDDDATILKNTVGCLASTRELIEKGKRSLEGKVGRAREGEYPGGYPPHGLDVVCFDSSGNPKWRLVWTGHFRRIKILNDGTEQKYVGKENVPAKDPTDTLRYRPSIRKDRLDTVRQIFEWYASEIISPTQIATRLNLAGIDPVFGEAWNKQKIKQMIRNPIYIGFPAFNKRGGGRHVEYVDGEYRRVRSVKGKVPTGRTRSRSDFVMPSKREFDPIVEPELFERCNRKMDADSERYKEKVPSPRSPKTASFWLRNIVVCAGCNRAMRAWNAMPNSANPYRSYFCANYGTYGRQNPSGCHANRVKAELIEKIVEIYLDETHTQISDLLKLESGENDEVLLPLEAEAEEKRQEWKKINRTIMAFVASCGSDGEDYDAVFSRTAGQLHEVEPGTDHGPIVTDKMVYEHLYAKMKPELKRAVSKLDKEHSSLVDKILLLPESAKVARKKADARLLQLEEQLSEAKERLENLSARSSAIFSEFRQRLSSIDEARDSIHSDTAFRRKAALVSQVIEKVVCRFKATGGTGKQPRTSLESVEIVPRVGDARRFYPDGIMRGKG